MAWMKRRNNSGGVQGDYLNTADTATRPMAIASLLLALIVISAIVLLLLSTGRWIYNRANTPSADAPTTSENQTVNEPNQTNSNEQPATSSSQETNTNQQPQSDTGNAAPQSSPQTASSPTYPSNVPSTGATLPEAVPNTGAGSTLTYFLIACALATISAYGWHIVRNRA